MVIYGSVEENLLALNILDSKIADVIDDVMYVITTSQRPMTSEEWELYMKSGTSFGLSRINKLLNRARDEIKAAKRSLCSKQRRYSS